MMEVKGRDLITGLPNTTKITSEEIEKALQNDIEKIIEAAKSILEETPPELSADIVENGVTLTGGGSLIHGIRDLFEEKLEIPVHLEENPLKSVAEGTGIMLANIHLAG